MNYQQRFTFFLLFDSVIVLCAILLARLLVNHRISYDELLVASISFLICHHIFSIAFHLYQKDWAYASIGELIVITKTVTATIIATALVKQILLQHIDFRLLIVTWLLHLLFIGGSRFCWRMFRDTFLDNKPNKKRTLIVGAGSAGTMVARQLFNGNVTDLLPIAFIDDSPKKRNLQILGIPVVGNVKKIEHIVKTMDIEHIIIAIPSLEKQSLNTIFRECAKTNAKTQILPMLEDILIGKLSVNKFRDVQVEDLLGREPVELNMDSISEYVTNKVILVTGAGGSIGSELCRQISKFHPKRLILLGHGENSIYTIEMELKANFKDLNIELITEIADIQDSKKMMTIMGTYFPDVVYHAAAHKHVPLMERNPEEAFKNNVIGTKNVAKAASWHDVKTFVMVSSDKAVNPTSVMGATKRLAEMIIQEMNQSSNTKFVAVRFGNVLGSRGSVVPLFKKQIENGGPVTVTDPEMIRYFMTIPEASRLLLQAGALAKGGEIFVLDMGQPVKIVDLARNLIKLSGHSLDDIGIQFTGIRPGEKLFEELLNKDEIHEEQIYPNIYVGKTRSLYLQEIEELIEQVEVLEKEELRKRIVELANPHVVPMPIISMTN